MLAKRLEMPKRSTALTAQIKAAERQVQIRKQQVRISAVSLENKLHDRITAPSTLLMACGVGFILGEITRQPKYPCAETAGKSDQAKTSPIITALNLMFSLHSLYRALPLAWLLKVFKQPQTPASTVEPEAVVHQSPQISATALDHSTKNENLSLRV